MKGKIHIGMTEYVISCGATYCYENEVYHTRTQKDFIRFIRSQGWKIRNKKWLCPKCLELHKRRRPTPNAADSPSDQGKWRAKHRLVDSRQTFTR